MTIRNTTIAKLQQLPESLLREVDDFIDFVIHKHQSQTAESQPDATLVEAWSQWFEGVAHLELTPPEPANNYQQLLLKKYRQQGLEL